MERDILGVQSESAELAENLQERIDIIKHKLKFFPDKPKVLCLQGVNPFLLANERLLETIKLAGGTPVISFYSIDDLINENPEIIILALSNEGLEESMKVIPDFLSFNGISELAAIKNNRLYITNSKTYFEKEGEFAVDALESIAEIITPKYFNFGFEGLAWAKFDLGV